MIDYKNTSGVDKKIIYSQLSFKTEYPKEKLSWAEHWDLFIAAPIIAGVALLGVTATFYNIFT